MVDVESGLPVSREPSWSHGRKGAPVVRAQWRRVVDDVDEASRRVCKAWGHVVDEDTRRCCQHRACLGGGEKMRRGSASHSDASEEAAWLGELQRRDDGKLVDVDEAPHRACQTRGHIVDEGTRRCCQHRACVHGDQQRRTRRRVRRQSAWGKVPMSHATLGVDEVVRKMMATLAMSRYWTKTKM